MKMSPQKLKRLINEAIRQSYDLNREISIEEAKRIVEILEQEKTGHFEPQNESDQELVVMIDKRKEAGTLPKINKNAIDTYSKHFFLYLLKLGIKALEEFSKAYTLQSDAEANKHFFEIFKQKVENNDLSSMHNVNGFTEYAEAQNNDDGHYAYIALFRMLDRTNDASNFSYCRYTIRLITQLTGDSIEKSIVGKYDNIDDFLEFAATAVNFQINWNKSL